jgi:hypothetical protein
VCLLFINPGGNGWLFLPNEYIEDWKIHLVSDLVFYGLCFSFLALINKNYMRVILLSSIALLNLIIVYYLVFKQKIDTTIVPFFHPITLSLPVICLFDKKYKLSIAGYFIGYVFSFGPILLSLIPILFSQLWFDSLLKPISKNKISRFLSRFFIYVVISILNFFLFFSITQKKLIFPAVSFSKSHELIMSLLAVITIYFILNQYLKHYYFKYGSRLLKILSYFPILWIIPLFEILFDGKIKKTNN